MDPLLGIYFQLLTCLETQITFIPIAPSMNTLTLLIQKFHACKFVKQPNLSFTVRWHFCMAHKIALGSCIEFSSLASLRVIVVYY